MVIAWCGRRCRAPDPAGRRGRPSSWRRPRRSRSGGARWCVRRREIGILEAEAADAAVSSSSTVRRAFSALPYMVGIDHERQVARPIDAIGLARKLAQGQHDEVGRTSTVMEATEPRTCRSRSRDLGDAGGDRIENTDPGWKQRSPASSARKRVRRSVQFMTISPLSPFFSKGGGCHAAMHFDGQKDKGGRLPVGPLGA